MVRIIRWSYSVNCGNIKYLSHRKLFATVELRSCKPIWIYISHILAVTGHEGSENLLGRSLNVCSEGTSLWGFRASIRGLVVGFPCNCRVRYSRADFFWNYKTDYLSRDEFKKNSYYIRICRPPRKSTPSWLLQNLPLFTFEIGDYLPSPRISINVQENTLKSDSQSCRQSRGPRAIFVGIP